MSATYTIQVADLSIKLEGPVDNARQVQSLLESFDWSSELAIQKQMEGRGEFNAPPNLIVLREVGIYYQLCPLGNGSYMAYCVVQEPTKLLGIIKWNKDVLLEADAISHTVAVQGITRFLNADESWLKRNIR